MITYICVHGFVGTYIQIRLTLQKILFGVLKDPFLDGLMRRQVGLDFNVFAVDPNDGDILYIRVQGLPFTTRKRTIGILTSIKYHQRETNDALSSISTTTNKTQAILRSTLVILSLIVPNTITFYITSQQAIALVIIYHANIYCSCNNNNDNDILFCFVLNFLVVIICNCITCLFHLN